MEEQVVGIGDAGGSGLAGLRQHAAVNHKANGAERDVLSGDRAGKRTLVEERGEMSAPVVVSRSASEQLGVGMERGFTPVLQLVEVAEIRVDLRVVRCDSPGLQQLLFGFGVAPTVDEAARLLEQVPRFRHRRIGGGRDILSIVRPKRDGQGDEGECEQTDRHKPPHCVAHLFVCRWHRA